MSVNPFSDESCKQRGRQGRNWKVGSLIGDVHDDGRREEMLRIVF